MEENEKINNENIKLDLKGTLEDFLKEEKPEVPQEDAIKLYKDEYSDYSMKKKKNSSDEEDDDENEDDEHLKRVKKELLESLERVKILEKKIFAEKSTIKGIKVKDSKVQDKNKVMNQMRQKIQEDQGRSREE